MSIMMLIPGVQMVADGADTVGPLIIGLIFSALGAYLLWRGRPQSQVGLQSASGETTAFSAFDDALVARVVHAVTESVVYRWLVAATPHACGEKRTLNKNLNLPLVNMNANETKLAQSKMQAASNLWASVLQTIRFIALCLTILAALKLIFAGLHGQSPESIGAIAKVIQAMNLGSLLGYGWGAVATGAWAIERSRRKKV